MIVEQKLNTGRDLFCYAMFRDGYGLVYLCIVIVISLCMYMLHICVYLHVECVCNFSLSQGSELASV